MVRPLDIRRALLAAVDYFIEGSPASVAHAHHLINRCRAELGAFTLDAWVWGPIVSELSDSLFYTDMSILRGHRSVLIEGSTELHRSYLNHDLARYFTLVEHLWREELIGMLDFLDSFPFVDRDAALQEYDRRKADIMWWLPQSPPPARLGEETIYHLILRQVSTVLINIDLYSSLAHGTHLVPQVPYSSLPPLPQKGRYDAPDISRDVEWARQALRSIVEQGWLLVMYQVTPTDYHLLLH